jgi:hypothetical protein
VIERCLRVTEEFFDEVHRKGDKFGRRMMYERKQQMCENI